MLQKAGCLARERSAPTPLKLNSGVDCIGAREASADAAMMAALRTKAEWGDATAAQPSGEEGRRSKRRLGAERPGEAVVVVLVVLATPPCICRRFTDPRLTRLCPAASIDRVHPDPRPPREVTAGYEPANPRA